VHTLRRKNQGRGKGLRQSAEGKKVIRNRHIKGKPGKYVREKEKSREDRCKGGCAALATSRGRQRRNRLKKNTLFLWEKKKKNRQKLEIGRVATPPTTKKTKQSRRKLEKKRRRDPKKVRPGGKIRDGD